MDQYVLINFEWRVIEPLLRTKLGGVQRVYDRRVLNENLLVPRPGGHSVTRRIGMVRNTCCNRFARWRKASA